ncbi:MAG: glycosyl transferase family 2 [Betaproteobacteria bacterium]|nr:glycosyl transferase family 2 [Betaproteobacteria bacterium]
MPDSITPTRFLRRRSVRQRGDYRTIDISVVVPTYRRPHLLRRSLESLLKQDFAPNRYEIIVCDDGPDAETEALVARLAAPGKRRRASIRYIPVEATQGPAGARNCGWRAARAPIIAFTDDDTIADRDWLSEGWRAMRPGVSAAGGRIDVPLPKTPTDYELDVAGLAKAEFATANCFVRKRVLERVGGFDERYTAAWREDSDLQFAILATGGTIVRADNALIFHPVRPAEWGVSIAQQKKSQFDVLLRRKYPAFYAKHIGRSPPSLYYLILASLAIAAIGLVTGEHALALAGLVGWLLFTAYFAFLRLRRTSHSARHMAEMIWTSIAIPPLSIFWRLHGALKFDIKH